MFKKIIFSMMTGIIFVPATYADVTVANVSTMSQPKIGYFYSIAPNMPGCENVQLQFNTSGNAKIPQSCLNNNSSTIEVYAENQPNIPITDSSCIGIANSVSQIWVSYSADSITCQSFDKSN